jgi:hypothetical protein
LRQIREQTRVKVEYKIWFKNKRHEIPSTLQLNIFNIYYPYLHKREKLDNIKFFSQTNNLLLFALSCD